MLRVDFEIPNPASKFEDLFVKRLKLVQFKNYDSLELQFSSRVVCFSGNNGVGKTNILDGISYICLGKSYFQSTDKQCLQSEKDFFRIEADFASEEDSATFELKYQPGKGKEIQWNDQVYERLSEHIGKVPLVVVAPNDIIDFLSGSAERRRFLDFTISQIDSGYLHQLMTYNRYLRQRNSALKMEDNGRPPDPDLLRAMSYQMEAPAQYIFDRRREFVEDFTPFLQKAQKTIAGSGEQIDIHFRSQLSEDSLAHQHEATMDKDRILQRTTRGVHKDDLKVKIDGHPLKVHASQGQRKTFMLALKTAQFQWLYHQLGEKPILLLDDFFEKLDAERLQSLVGMVLEMDFGQIFITDTESDRLRNLLKNFREEYALFHITRPDGEGEKRVREQSL